MLISIWHIFIIDYFYFWKKPGFQAQLQVNSQPVCRKKRLISLGICKESTKHATVSLVMVLTVIYCENNSVNNSG